MKTLDSIFRKNSANRFLYYILTIILMWFLVAGCKKEADPGIRITNLAQSQTVFESDTLRIQYHASTTGLDSVCLVINDVKQETQTAPLNFFNYIPTGEGSWLAQLRLDAYYKSGIVKSTEIYYINVSNLITPPLRYLVSRFDGLSNYFVGEKLSITIQAIEGDLKEFKKIKVYLNEIDLGTSIAAPYIFISEAVVKSENTINVELTDQSNRIHHVKMQMTVPVNTPPVVTYYLNYNENAEHGAYLSSDSISTVFSGFDNIKIDHVDVILDNQKVTSFIINNSSGHKVINLGYLPTGSHSVYCNTYDDRGLSSKSVIIPFSVFGGFELADPILDLEYSDKAEITFALSKSKLYVINPVREELTKVIELPYSDATSMDFVPEENSMYIAFNQGKLFRWNGSSQLFSEIALSAIPGIQDIEIDAVHNAVMISNNKLLFYNILTGKRSSGAVALNDGATLVFDKSEKLVVSGGFPHSSGGYIYEHKLISDSLHYLRRDYTGGFAEKIQLDPTNNRYIISGRSGYRTGVTTYDLISFSIVGVLNVLYPLYATFSTDGNLVFVGDDNNHNISVFDPKNNSLIKEIAIPTGVYNTINMFGPNINNTALIVVRKHIFKPEGRIFFVRLN